LFIQAITKFALAINLTPPVLYQTH